MQERFTNEEYKQLADKITLPFDLNKKIQEGKGISEVFAEVEAESQGSIQVLRMLRDLTEFLFIKPLDEMQRYVEAYFYLYREIAQWRIALQK